jgi:hypothetical protein
MHGLYVKSGTRERAFNVVAAEFEITHFDFDVRAHATALAQLRRSRSNAAALLSCPPETQEREKLNKLARKSQTATTKATGHANTARECTIAAVS